MDEQSIFLNALEKETPEARAAWLAQACGADLRLKARIEALLASHEQASRFLEQPPAAFQETVVHENRDADRAGALEGGLTATFVEGEAVVIGPAGHSVFQSLGRGENFPRVALREAAENGTDPIVRPQSPEMPQKDADSRYQLQGEIARGGMGAVLKGRDTDLGRDLAIKVLLDSHKNKPEIVQRFIEEAQIGGQLQHPGIAPVYELGQFSDRRPFFSMKLVKGETLSKILAQRKSPAEDRGRFLGIFEHVCQTMAYAHSRGVIHRDLKPANIMVGAFGEVQVMDWGLAKVLPSGGVADERMSQTRSSEHSVVQTLRSRGGGGDKTPEPVGSFGSQTQIGSVMGTPAYMPPEQALGEIDNLDERADVFGLGAILCEVLTGRPPYIGDDGTHVFRLATRGKLEGCFARLDACGADAELIALAKQCLELEPKDRPRDAGVLANHVTTYLTSVEARLRAVEIDRAAAAARAEEALLTAREHQAAASAERRARRLQLGLASVILFVTTFGGISAVWTAIVQHHLRQNAEAAEQAANTAREAESRQLVRAEQERVRAESEQKRAESEKRRSDNMLADMQTERGLRAGSEGQTAAAAMWFAHAATITPHDPDRQQANRLRARSWMNQAMMPVARLTLPEGDASRLAFQPNGPFLLALKEGSLRVWDWRNGVTVPWSDPLIDVTDADWSPDGRQVALAFGPAEVRLLESISGKELGRLRPAEHVSVVRWSPDGKRLALGSRKTQVWNLEAEPRKETEWPHPGVVYGLNFNRSGSQVVTACEDNLARVFSVANTASTRPVLPPLEHTPFFRNMWSLPVFCDQDRKLVTILKEGRTPGLWTLAAAGTVANPWKLGPDFDRALDVSPDGRWIAAAGVAQCALVGVDGTVVNLPHRNHLHHAVFNPTGRSLVTLSYEGIARVWPMDMLKEKQSPAPSVIPQQNTYAHGWFSPDGVALAIASNGQVVVWEQAPESALVGRVDWQGHVWHPRISFDGRFVTPGVLHETSFNPKARGGLLSVASMADGQPAGPPIPLPGLLYDSCISSDNRSVAAAIVKGSTALLGVFDIATAQPLFPAVPLPALPASIDAHPHQPEVAVLCQDGQLLLIDARNGQTRQALNHDGHHAGTIWSRVRYSPDGEALVSVITDNLVSVRESATGALRFPALKPVSQGGPCRTIAFSKDSRLLVTGVCGKNMAQVWDLQTGQKRGREMPHGGDFYGLWSVDFSPDGQRVVTGHKDGRVRIWDWQTGQIIGTPMQHADEVFHATFTPDGRYVLAGPRRSTLHIWDPASGKLAVAPVPELVPSRGSTTHVSLFGHRAVVSEEGRYSILDLTELLKSPVESIPSLLNRAELASNLHQPNGEQLPLDLEQWNTRWDAYIRTREAPDQTAASLAKALDDAQLESQRRVIIARALRLNLLDSLVPLRPNDARLHLDYLAEMTKRGRSTRAMVSAAIAAVNSVLRTTPDDQSLQRELARLRILELEPTKWTALDPVELRATSGSPFTKQPDGSILAEGKPAPKDEYTLVGPSPLPQVAALRLEALPHPGLPVRGSGHDFKGNFCLSEVTLGLRRSDGQTAPLKFRLAASDYVRPLDVHTHAPDGPWGAIDGRPSTRWDVYPPVTQPHWLILELDTPCEVQTGEQLVVSLQFLTSWGEARLGRFRLSVSDEPRAVEKQILTSAVQTSILSRDEALSALDLVHRKDAAVIERLGAPDRAESLTLAEELLLAQACFREGKTDLAEATGKRVLERGVHGIPHRELWSLYVDVVTRASGIAASDLPLDPTNEEVALARWNQEIHAAPTADKYRARAVLLTRLRQWSQAVPDFLSEVPLRAREAARVSWMRAGLCHLMAGDEAGYRQHCALLLKEYQNSTNLDERETLVKLGLLLPGALPVSDLPIDGLHQSLKTYMPTYRSHPWAAAMCGLAALRAGDTPKALEWIDKVESPPPPLVSHILLIRALAEEERGHHEAAVKALTAAEALIPAELELAGSPLGPGEEPLSEKAVDQDALLSELLRREASQRIRGTVRRLPSGQSLEAELASLALAGRWPEATLTALQILDQDPTSRFNITRVAALQGLTGDTDGYRKLCSRVVEQFADTTRFEVADTVCKITLLHPESPHRDRLPVKVLREALEREMSGDFPKWGWAGLGLVEYRDRRFQEAIACCEKSHVASLREGAPAALAFVIEAMSWHELKEAAKAKEALARATAILEAGRVREGAAKPAAPPTTIEYDLLVAEVLCREAEKLIEAPPR